MDHVYSNKKHSFQSVHGAWREHDTAKHVEKATFTKLMLKLAFKYIT